MQEGNNAEESSKRNYSPGATQVESPELFNLKETYRAITLLTKEPAKQLNESITLIDASMRDVINTMGQGENISDGIRKNIADAVPLITKLGGDTKDTLDVQMKTLEAFGRNIVLSDKQTEELYATFKVTGVGVKDLETAFMDAGMSLKDISKEMITVRETANALGVNAKAASSTVVTNLDKLNRYTFQGGVEGLAKMADRKSTRLNSSHVSESRMPSSA